MKLLRSIVFYFILTLTFQQSLLYSQNASELKEVWQQLDKKYGFDSELINGIKYYPIHSKSTGNPFLNGIEPITSDIVINKHLYNGVKILYEINLQKLILVYKDYTGGENKIILNTEWVDTFRINFQTFIKTPFSNSKTPFVEVGVEGPVSFYRSFYKEENFKSDGNTSGYFYSKVMVLNYIVIQGKVNSFKNNKQLINCIPEEIQDKIKLYLSRNKIKVNKASMDELKNVFIYINSLNTSDQKN